MKRNLATRRLDSTLVLRQGAAEPTDEEWNELLGALEDLHRTTGEVKFLVVTDGGGPSPPQRKRLGEALGGQNFRVAVVTDSVKARFVSAAVALFNPNTQAFTRAELPSAYKFLGISEREQELATAAISDLTALIQES